MKVRKKAKSKKLYWLLADLAAAIVIFALLLYKPARYDPIKVTPAGNNQVSTYLTHELLTQLYNGAQRGKPFDLVVTQEGINDIVIRSKWPRESDGITFSAPAVLFVPDGIILMGTANVKRVKFVVTIVLTAKLNEEGLLNLQVAKVKVGAMSITPLAKVMAKRMYQQRLATSPIDKEDLRAKIAASLLNDEPFEPVFKVKDVFEKEGEKVRIKKITIKQQTLILRLAPVSDQSF